MKGFSDRLVQSSPFMLAITGPDGVVIKMSDSMLRVLGYDSEEVVGESFIERIVAEECRSGARRFFQESRENGRFVSGEIRLTTKPGGSIPVEWQIQTMWGDDGEAEFILGAGLDLTERKRMEYELMHERQEQLQMFDSVPALLFYKNKNNRYIRVNRAFSTLLGIPKENIEGAPMSAVLPDIAAKTWNEDREVIASGRPKRNILQIMETKNGTRWVQTDKYPFRDEQGKIVGVLGVGVDMTESRGAEGAIQALIDGDDGASDSSLFDRITSRIREWLGTDFALVLRITDGSQAEVLSMREGDKHAFPFGFRVKSTIFAHVCDEGYVHCADKAGARFPAIEEILRVPINGFVLTVIRDRSGIPVGCICAASRKRLFLPKRTEEVLRIFAAKAALEIERIRSRTALLESEERYRSLVEASPNAIAMADLDGTLITVNHQFACLMGGEIRDIFASGRKVLDYLACEDRYWGIRNTRRLLDTQIGRMSGECTIRRFDGSTFPAEINVTLVRDEHGVPHSIIGVLHDITERKEAENRLREKHALLELRLRNERMLSEIASLLASASTLEAVFARIIGIIRQTLAMDRVSILRYSPELDECTPVVNTGNATFSNRSLCDTLRRSQLMKEVVLNNRLVSLNEFDRIEPAVREALSVEGIRSLTLVPLGSGASVKGAIVLCRIDEQELKPEERDLFGIIADMIANAIEKDTNFRARIDAERRHAEAMKMAERTSRLASVGTLAAGISHEINQPLTALKVKVDSILYWKELNQPIPQDDLEQDLRFLSQQADRIDEIIKHMRALARQERGQEPVDVDMNQVISDVLPLLRQRISAHGISISQDMDDALPPIRGHQPLLQQVVINLIVNAIHAHDEHKGTGKTIHISTRHDDHTCIFEVTDNGPGIPEANLNRVFDPFFTTKVGSEGMGLGLSICHNVVAGLGGVISVENTLSKGARFIVSIPAVCAGKGEK